jgi:hypothetical protein
MLYNVGFSLPKNKIENYSLLLYKFTQKYIDNAKDITKSRTDEQMFKNSAITIQSKNSNVWTYCYIKYPVSELGNHQYRYYETNYFLAYKKHNLKDCEERKNIDCNIDDYCDTYCCFDCEGYEPDSEYIKKANNAYELDWGKRKQALDVESFKKIHALIRCYWIEVIISNSDALYNNKHYDYEDSSNVVINLLFNHIIECSINFTKDGVYITWPKIWMCNNPPRIQIEKGYINMYKVLTELCYVCDVKYRSGTYKKLFDLNNEFKTIHKLAFGFVALHSALNSTENKESYETNEFYQEYKTAREYTKNNIISDELKKSCALYISQLNRDIVTCTVEDTLPGESGDPDFVSYDQIHPNNSDDHSNRFYYPSYNFDTSDLEESNDAASNIKKNNSDLESNNNSQLSTLEKVVLFLLICMVVVYMIVFSIPKIKADDLDV